MYGSESVEKVQHSETAVDTNQLSGSAKSERTSRMKRRKVL